MIDPTFTFPGQTAAAAPEAATAAFLQAGASPQQVADTAQGAVDFGAILAETLDADAVPNADVADDEPPVIPVDAALIAQLFARPVAIAADAAALPVRESANDASAAIDVDPQPEVESTDRSAPSAVGNRLPNQYFFIAPTALDSLPQTPTETGSADEGIRAEGLVEASADLANVTAVPARRSDLQPDIAAVASDRHTERAPATPLRLADALSADPAKALGNDTLPGAELPAMADAAPSAVRSPSAEALLRALGGTAVEQRIAPAPVSDGVFSFERPGASPAAPEATPDASSEGMTQIVPDVAAQEVVKDERRTQVSEHAESTATNAPARRRGPSQDDRQREQQPQQNQTAKPEFVLAAASRPARGVEGGPTPGPAAQASFVGHVAAPLQPAASLPTVQAAIPSGVAEHAAEVTSQVVQAVRLQWRQGVGEATLRLQPGQLGTVTVALRVERGMVAAVLQAENPAVQQWIEGNAGQLRSALADQGLQLDRFIVRTDPDGRQTGRERRESRPRQPRANGKHDRFELAA